MEPEPQQPDSPTPPYPVPEVPDTSGLQFDKAEFSGRQCGFCSQAIEVSYYQFGADTVCSACAAVIARKLEKPGKPELMRASLYGFGAAFAAAIVMGIVLLWGWQLALLSIFAGSMIAKAMKHATAQRGSRALQVWAVAFTYFACTASFAPVIVRGLFERAQEQDKKAEKEGKKKAAELKQKLPTKEAFIAVGAGTVLIVGISMLSPFLMITDGISGILNILIIGFGLMQAWKAAAPIGIPLLGPYSNGSSEGPPA